MKKVITGNHAVSFGAKLARVEVIAAYPITPQTEVVEKLSEIVSDGELAAKFIKVESEHSAMAACIGASVTGARAFTATSSQGLALMHEMLHWATGARVPIVMANINRTLGPPWNIWSEQTDSLSQRDTGWLQFYCENNQEILDTVIQAFKICEKVSLPGMICLDAFYHSHTSEVVDLPEQKSIDKFLPKYDPKYKLDINEPHTFGGLTSPEWYYELRYKIQSSMEDALGVISETGKEYAAITGRRYGLIDEYKTEDADEILITAGAMSQTAKEAVDLMREKNKKVGLLRIRTFRPFPKNEVRKIIKRAKSAGVIDRDISFGSEGIFFQEVKSALYRESARPPIYGFIAGLGGRDVTIDEIIKIAESMPKMARNNEFTWVGAKI
ncbi:MAG: pyruvate ferredoxin oxidoreductase [Candidatus Omnitrophica bacterium]|nr:pyruvate ferredoxin oxidoreductase [Candidatus Omnitrophota bacterium]MBU4488858.1 pyruvate ferredoxin oxidoreductase [Candidatus Omnitrophota bacterium]MCG2705656.1 pyruvate ferredoxin oxidoreductase [Candidatus Omnitrophota bacterium]